MIGRALWRRPVPAVAETAEVVAHGRVIALSIRVNARASRVSLRLPPDGGAPRLTLPSPQHLPRGLAFARSRADWLAEQLDKRRDSVRPFAPGAVVPFDGQPLLLAISGGRSAQRVGNRLEAGGDPALFAARVKRWMLAEARLRLTADTMVVAEQHGLDVTNVRVADPRSRWGSCAPGGRIAFSWRLMLAPVDVRASVVAHEVAHLLHPNHGPAFWALAEHMLGAPHGPARAWLRRHGGALHGWGAAMPPPLSES